MRVPLDLSHAFEAEFQALLSEFIQQHFDVEHLSGFDLQNRRYLTRSIVPHLQKLSDRFNRKRTDPELGDPKHLEFVDYWKLSSNPLHLRLSYFLGFMPTNLYRVAAVWSELVRLGYRWPSRRELKGIEWGAGPASGLCGIGIGNKLSDGDLPHVAEWALIEKDLASLKLGSAWSQFYLQRLGYTDWATRPFHRRIDFTQPLLPRTSPQFNFWLSSFFLNEIEQTPAEIAKSLYQTWEQVLEPDSLIVLVEPALQAQSRKLLSLRQALLELDNRNKRHRLPPLRVLTPCLGNQSCGALAKADDWCHEEVTWWRPPYLRILDEILKQDHKVLHFSYLVLTFSERPLQEILPGLPPVNDHQRYRLVSPPYDQGRLKEFFVCSSDGDQGTDGKFKARSEQTDLERGDILSSIKGRYS